MPNISMPADSAGTVTGMIEAPGADVDAGPDASRKAVLLDVGWSGGELFAWLSPDQARALAEGLRVSADMAARSSGLDQLLADLAWAS